MTGKENNTENSNFEMILQSASKLPSIRIYREKFLRKELKKHFDKDTVENAIKTNPAQAGISAENLEKIARSCITYETRKVTGLSAAAGAPGGLAMIGTIPADIAQYFGHIIRIVQKLSYLYGWQEFFLDIEDGLDDETSNQLTLFIGVMFGVNTANAAIAKIAEAAAKNAQKQLVKRALTKGTIYPIVKHVAKLIGVKVTKDVFAKSVGKIIPFIGAVVSGGITYISFRPMAKRFQKYLATLPLADVDYYKNAVDNNESVIDINFS